ncbi:acyl-CoA-binding protein [Streptomyces sp. NBC_00344]|uniref:acyl-CoA-binding protein n=1 Tax=Streptomyces sp. NBC_00344 TaxID=2975720 RepID=UPI002E1A18DC
MSGVSQEQFNRAVEIIQELPHDGPLQPSPEEGLYLYACYKQATSGDNMNLKPDPLDHVATAEWNAWTQLAGTPQAEAQKAYVTKTLELLKRHSSDPATRHRLEELEATT